MTVTAHRLRTLDETRVLPSPSDDAGWSAGMVRQIATWVDLPAHGLAHPRPVLGCPWCPPAEGDVPQRSCETYWREVAERRPSWGGVTP